jgi:hypothetical protein
MYIFTLRTIEKKVLIFKGKATFLRENTKKPVLKQIRPKPKCLKILNCNSAESVSAGFQCTVWIFLMIKP